jgi:hypothetical protein
VYPFTGLRLLLPALVPSWRFFDAVGASPRVEYALLPGPDPFGAAWAQARPRVARLGLRAMLLRLVWNPDWTESLFLVSLCERLMQASGAGTVEHSERELLLRVARGLGDGDGHSDSDGDGLYLHVRVRLVARSAGAGPAGGRITAHVAHVCPPHPMAQLQRP